MVETPAELPFIGDQVGLFRAQPGRPKRNAYSSSLHRISYWQTIEAYPSNGGSYTVAKENLGANAGLLAAAALRPVACAK